MIARRTASYTLTESPASSWGTSFLGFLPGLGLEGMTHSLEAT
jgi:hypothetical protein